MSFTSTTFVIEMRDKTEHRISGHALVVENDAIQIQRKSGSIVAAFPIAGVSAVLPVEPPELENIVWTGKDYALNHALVPFIEERELLADVGATVNLDRLAEAVLEPSGDGVKVKYTGARLEAAIRSLVFTR